MPVYYNDPISKADLGMLDYKLLYTLEYETLSIYLRRRVICLPIS